MTKKTDTRLVEAGRHKDWTMGVVNPPVFHASTCVFETLADMEHAIANPDDQLFYGRRGTPTTWALEEAMTELEDGCAGTKLTPSGVSAIAASLLAFLRPGDHVLMADSVYEPSRLICQGLLKAMNISHDFYDPLIGPGIKDLMKPNTKVVFVESPGSLTFEVQDIPAISKAAHDHDAVVICDNTWATPLYFNAYAHGADVVIHALTKYVVGHSDAMLGSVGANKQCWPRLQNMVYRLGLCAGPDDAYLGLRGLRTMGTRLRQQGGTALELARKLENHDEIAQVLHPALPNCPGHEIWKRDFTGSSGLFSIVLKRGEWANLAPMVDHMNHFRMGFSWGGYESLILPARFNRSAKKWEAPGPLLRLNVGLEDAGDLYDDLAKGLERYAQALA
ncbi:MAG: cystathionine beta-lyase [Sphingomonadales bacterium]|jgi:cystathionine beta-lyase